MLKINDELLALRLIYQRQPVSHPDLQPVQVQPSPSCGISLTSQL
jgi:hypothetical protein